MKGFFGEVTRFTWAICPRPTFYSKQKREKNFGSFASGRNTDEGVEREPTHALEGPRKMVS